MSHLPLLRRTLPLTPLLATLLFAWTAPATAVAPQNRVNARAYALRVNAPTMGIADTYYCDTGWLSPAGGNASDAMTAPSVANLFTSDTMSASALTFSDGDDCSDGDSSVQLGATVLLPGHPAEVSFLSLSSDDHDDCCEESHSAPLPAQITGLNFGGQPVTVTGTYNQTVTISGVGTLTVNELTPQLDQDDDKTNCGLDDGPDSISSLHLVLDNGDEFIIGSSYYDLDDDDCCAVPAEATSWGLLKTRY